MSKKKLKVFMTAWHIMHYTDFANAMKDYVDIYMCTNTWREWRTDIFRSLRNIPENITFVPQYEKGKYDFAILGVDQQCVNLQIGKRRIYREFRETIGDDIPVVTINHGSPVYPEYTRTFKKDEKTGKNVSMTNEEADKVCIEGIKKLIGNGLMVTNSHTAASKQEWGFGHPIRHGLNDKDWYDLPKEPRIFTALSEGGCDEYYNRQCMTEVSSLLNETGYTLFWAKVNTLNPRLENPRFSGFGGEKYRDFLGRSLIYIDTSFRTPLNRARTEAMLSGCCVIQVKGDYIDKIDDNPNGTYKEAHDLDYFAEDGKNIILVDNNPKKIAKLAINFIENDYDKAIEIGQNAKKTAMEKFNYEIYRKNWLEFINNKVLNGRDTK